VLKGGVRDVSVVVQTLGFSFLGRFRMSRKWSSGLAFIALFTFVVVATVQAGTDRTYWRHSKGHFENTKGNAWLEKSPDDTFRFVETDRNTNFVQLYDKSRECTVRLFGDRCMVKFGAEKFKFYYDGKWVR
jgi:hypothetical protein